MKAMETKVSLYTATLIVRRKKLGSFALGMKKDGPGRVFGNLLSCFPPNMTELKAARTVP